MEKVQKSFERNVGNLKIWKFENLKMGACISSLHFKIIISSIFKFSNFQIFKLSS
jgi:hypothetical protein